MPPAGAWTLAVAWNRVLGSSRDGADADGKGGAGAAAAAASKKESAIQPAEISILEADDGPANPASSTQIQPAEISFVDSDEEGVAVAATPLTPAAPALASFSIDDAPGMARHSRVTVRYETGPLLLGLAPADPRSQCGACVSQFGRQLLTKRV